MKTNNRKWILATSVAVIIGSIWIALGAVLNVLNATVVDGGHMHWNPEMKVWQISMIAGYLIFSIGFTAVLVTLLRNINSEIKKGIYFTKRNARLIGMCGFLYMFLIFFRTNFWHAVAGAIEREYPYGDMIIPALILTIFAHLYAIAYRVSEENSLTI